MSNLGETLNLVEVLIQVPKTTPQLMARTGLSHRTIRRRMAEARQLGVELQARQMETNEHGRLTGPYYWTVTNAQDIEPQLSQWLALERARSLRGQSTHQKPVRNEP